MQQQDRTFNLDAKQLSHEHIKYVDPFVLAVCRWPLHPLYIFICLYSIRLATTYFFTLCVVLCSNIPACVRCVRDWILWIENAIALVFGVCVWSLYTYRQKHQHLSVRDPWMKMNHNIFVAIADRNTASFFLCHLCICAAHVVFAVCARKQLQNYYVHKGIGARDAREWANQKITNLSMNGDSSYNAYTHKLASSIRNWYLAGNYLGIGNKCRNPIATMHLTKAIVIHNHN